MTATGRRTLASFALAVLFAASPQASAADVQTPESIIGFKVGADRKLADWTQIVDYFRKLDAASERVKIDGEMKTTQGRPFLSVVITSEANMGNLEAIRQANQRLADPRGLSDDEAKKLVATGKTIIGHNHGIHSTESRPRRPRWNSLTSSRRVRIRESWRFSTSPSS